MIEVRCFSCGKPIADKYEEFVERTKAGEDAAKVLDELDIKRYCCRRMFLGHVDLIDEIIQYPRF
jgi:DNA-directed RNA polymerase subunit N